MSTSTKTVSDVTVEQLAAWGVKYVFGIPGHTSLRMVEALRRQDKIKYIRVRHEETAALMASAYAKLTGNVGVCLTIAGPGATNLMTGLYDAKMDRAPVLALTGQVRLQYIGPGSFQEIDQDALFEPVSIFNKTINSKDQTTELLTLALKHAIVDRGVAHLSIPNDIQSEPFDTEIKPKGGRIPDFRIEPPEELIDEAIELIENSQRPVIIAGWGAMGQGETLIKIAQKISAPIATTFRAKGIIPENHDLCLGVLGDVGTPVARRIINDSDLLLVFGSSFSDKTSIPKTITTIQVDIDPFNIGKTSPIRLGIWGNTASVLPKLLEKLKPKNNQQMLEKVKKLKEEWQERLRLESDSRAIPIRLLLSLKLFKKL